MSQLSEHFTLAELTHTDHREFDNTPNEQELANLYRLAEFLELVKTALGGKPIIVNSAFRSKQVNDAVGSKDTSQHRLGCAADIRSVSNYLACSDLSTCHGNSLGIVPKLGSVASV